jgi:hypothetical protein
MKGVQGGIKKNNLVDDSAVLPSTAEFFYAILQLKHYARSDLITAQLIFNLCPSTAKKPRVKSNAPCTK